jgi:hypothetical protein
MSWWGVAQRKSPVPQIRSIDISLSLRSKNKPWKKSVEAGLKAYNPNLLSLGSWRWMWNILSKHRTVSKLQARYKSEDLSAIGTAMRKLNLKGAKYSGIMQWLCELETGVHISTLLEVKSFRFRNFFRERWPEDNGRNTPFCATPPWNKRYGGLALQAISFLGVGFLSEGAEFQPSSLNVWT